MSKPVSRYVVCCRSDGAVKGYVCFYREVGTAYTSLFNVSCQGQGMQPCSYEVIPRPLFAAPRHIHRGYGCNQHAGLESSSPLLTGLFLDHLLRVSVCLDKCKNGCICTTTLNTLLFAVANVRIG